jgi:hypothetical protein
MKSTILVFIDYHIGEFNFIFPVLLDLLEDRDTVVYLVFTRKGILEAVREDPLLGPFLDRERLYVVRAYTHTSSRSSLLRRLCNNGRLAVLVRRLVPFAVGLLAWRRKREGPVYVGVQLESDLRLPTRGVHYFTFAHATDVPTIRPQNKGAYSPPVIPTLLNKNLPLLCFLQRSESYYTERGFPAERIVETGLECLARLYREMQMQNTLPAPAAGRIVFFMCFPQDEWLPLAEWVQQTEAAVRTIREFFPQHELLGSRHPNTISDPGVLAHLRHLEAAYGFRPTVLTQHSLIASGEIVVGLHTTAFFPAVVRPGVHSCYINAIVNTPDFSTQIVNGRLVANNYDDFVAWINDMTQFAEWLRGVRDGTRPGGPNPLAAENLGRSTVQMKILDHVRALPVYTELLLPAPAVDPTHYLKNTRSM